VLTLLNDGEWAQWSDREIARRCAVNHEMVGRIRVSLAENASDDSGIRTYTTKHGTPRFRRRGCAGHAPWASD
jgi:hypothetical protein